MKKVCTYICLLTVLWLLAAGTVLEQQRLAARVIRLHILANSDSAEDQTEKLRVRDALLGEIEALTADCTSREEAAAKLAGAAEELGERAAAMTGRPVTVSLSPERYGTRHYGSFSLPAGPISPCASASAKRRGTTGGAWPSRRSALPPQRRSWRPRRWPPG